MTRGAHMTDARRADAASQWLLQLAEGPIALEKQIAFELWLDADPENRATFAELAAVWRKTAELAELPELAEIRADALRAMHDGIAGRWRRMMVRRVLPALAAAACLVLAVLAVQPAFQARPHLYQTATTERRVITLDDGSRLSLDASTQVEVAYSKEHRALRLLAGRAKFDVVKDPLRPFTVAAGGRVVVSTGTAFSVELLRGQIQVVLYEGSVAVLEDGPRDRPPRHVDLTARRIAADTMLKPGTVLIAALDRKFAAVQPADLARSLSWESGQLSFADEPLALAAERMNRYSDQKIVIGDAATGRLPVSGAFNAGDTEGFVEGVGALYGLRRTRSGNDVTLSGAP